MLQKRMDKCKREEANVQDHIEKVREDASEFNLTRLKTAISEPPKTRDRVKETRREIAEHNLRQNAGNSATQARIAKNVKKPQIITA